MAPSILTDDSNVLATPVWKLSNFNIKHYVSYLRKLVTVKTCCRVSQNYCPNHQLKAHSHTPQRSADSTVDCINEEMLSVETQLSIVESVLVWTSLKAKPVLQHLSQINAFANIDDVASFVPLSLALDANNIAMIKVVLWCYNCRSIIVVTTLLSSYRIKCHQMLEYKVAQFFKSCPIGAKEVSTYQVTFSK